MQFPTLTDASAVLLANLSAIVSETTLFLINIVYIYIYIYSCSEALPFGFSASEMLRSILKCHYSKSKILIPRKEM